MPGGYVVPIPLTELPALTDHQRDLYDAWRVLSVGRPMTVGMSRAFACPLPAGDVVTVARVYGFEPRPFLHLCRELDALYLDNANR